jgi:hypothetical protein
VADRLLTDAFDPKNLLLSSMGPQSVAIGAATLYLNEALKQPESFLIREQES